MLLETFMNAYHVCIHKLLCLHIMRRKKNIRFLSLHNILGMFSFVASKFPEVEFTISIRNMNQHCFFFRVSICGLINSRFPITF